MDDAVNLAKNICAASAEMVCLCLMPVIHGSTSQATVVKHRRHMEDLLMACFGKSFCNMVAGFQGAWM